MEKDKKIPKRPADPKNEKKSSVQTYAGDMAEALKGDNRGFIKKIIHGEEEYDSEKKNLSPESRKNRIFMFVGLLFVFLAFLTLFFFLFKKDINTVSVDKQFVPIIFNEQSTFLEISGLKKEEIIQTILTEVNSTKTKIGGIKGIYLTENKQIVGFRKFNSLIKSSFVPGNNKIFLSDNFLMGSMLTGLNSVSPTAGDFFIILKVNSILDVFDSFHMWENKMLFDLHGFFGVNLNSETNYLFTKNFEDSIIDNKNARVLYDKDGKIVLSYIFADDNSIIITASEAIAHEIMLRLASSKKKQ